jgi:hypothetical protein
VLFAGLYSPGLAYVGKCVSHTICKVLSAVEFTYLALHSLLSTGPLLDLVEPPFLYHRCR